MEQMSLLDICSSRHKGNPESVAAFAIGKKDRMREWVLSWVKKAGSAGVTLDETALAFGMTPNQLSGRFSDLLKDGAIRRTGEKRKTKTGAWAAVYVAVA